MLLLNSTNQPSQSILIELPLVEVNQYIFEEVKMHGGRLKTIAQDLWSNNDEHSRLSLVRHRLLQHRGRAITSSSKKAIVAVVGDHVAVKNSVIWVIDMLCEEELDDDESSYSEDSNYG